MFQEEKLMKYIVMCILFCYSLISFADTDSNLSFGLGHDHAGVVGVKYAINRDQDKYYGSFGLLSYSRFAGTKIGYGLGWERLFLGENNAFGLFAGTVSSHIRNSKAAVYHGVAATYNYYFLGFDEKSFVLGGSVYYGKTFDDDRRFDNNSGGSMVKIAYQW